MTVWQLGKGVLTIPSRVIATCFALVSFAAALIAGFAAGNNLLRVVVRAIVVMVAAWIVGTILGTIAQHTVDEHIESYRRDHPIPTEDAAQTGEPASSSAVETAAPQQAASAATQEPIADVTAGASTTAAPSGTPKPVAQPSPPRVRQPMRDRNGQTQAA